MLTGNSPYIPDTTTVLHVVFLYIASTILTPAFEFPIAPKYCHLYRNDVGYLFEIHKAHGHVSSALLLLLNFP